MNELLFLLIALIDLAFVLLAWRLGKEWVLMTIVLNIVLVSSFASKLIPFFGLSTTAAGPFYAAIFIATDILTEHHGKKEGYRSVWMGFLALLAFVIFGQLVLILTPGADSQAISGAMQSVFGAVPRIALASLVAYVIAQNFDIWFYHFIHDITGRRYLWVRNNLSTLVSQFLDSTIFFTIAFAGAIPFGVLVQITLLGYLIKLGVALIDTPFIYLSYVVKGMHPPDFGRDRGITNEPPAKANEESPR